MQFRVRQVLLPVLVLTEIGDELFNVVVNHHLIQ
jgi:hypothetical protein